MRLSFVIPAHNEAAYLPHCLDSIVEQTKLFPSAVEIIVVDNASTDATAAIAKTYPAVKVIFEPNKGLVQARQAGYLAASGDLIANVDADTILTPGWLRRVFDEFGQDSNLIALTGPVIYYDLPKRIRFFVRLFFYAAFFTHINNHFIFRISAVIQGGNFVLRQSALKALGGYDTRLTFYGEDADIARRLTKLGRVKFTFKFPMFASGRRLAAEGVVTMGTRYALNYFWITFFKKPFSKTYHDIRSLAE
ncbi:MAG: glycosyltransferase family 2 protein [Candidatus Kerfeldbacteria bacterium]|nr:glycosyltransferase family 2 protein [Candidatus Kerfeldbacteria bacterium]